MMKLFFFNILILLAVISQGISTLVEGNEQLSDILARKKRVISPVTDAKIARYAVAITQNGKHVCGGAILARNVVITAAHCVYESGNYHVLSGAKELKYAFKNHVRHIEIHSQYNPRSVENNLALLVVLPPIVLRLRGYNRAIEIHNETLHTGYQGVLSGWGSTTLQGPNIISSDILHSTYVKILTWQDCAARYGNEHDQFTNLEICTHDPPEGLKRSGYNDAGDPLTVADQLVGILAWSRVVTNRQTPDVYANVALPVYKQWIDEFMRIHAEYGY